MNRWRITVNDGPDWVVISVDFERLESAMNCAMNAAALGFTSIITRL